jgi:hypothetical protein
VSTRACNLSEAEVSKTDSEAAPFRSYSYQKLELQKLTLLAPLTPPHHKICNSDHDNSSTPPCFSIVIGLTTTMENTAVEIERAAEENSEKVIW